MSYDTVMRWKNKFKSGEESIENAPKSGRQTFASSREIVSKINEIIEGDVKFTVRDIAVVKVVISLSTVHFNLKKHLKVRKILLDGCHICLLMSKTDNGLKWQKSCFKCFKLVTKKTVCQCRQS